MMEDVDEFIANLLNDLKRNRLTLPTLPQVALRINNTIDDPISTAKNIAKIISTDAALTARMIQTANSAFYRRDTRVEDVQAAVTRLGVKVVRNIVTSLLIKQVFHTKYKILKNHMENLWLHSTHVAAISFVLAKTFTSLKPEEAMLGGLIHDIGELPILAYAEKYPLIANDEPTLNKIIEKIGPALGKTMLQTWKFSPQLVTVAAEREYLSRNSAEPVDYTDVVMIANLHCYIGAQHRLAKVNWSSIPAFNKLGLTPDQSIKTMHEAGEEILEIKKLLSD